MVFWAASLRNYSRKIEKRVLLDLVVTPPSVVYKVLKTNEQALEIHNPADWPEQTK